MAGGGWSYFSRKSTVRVLIILYRLYVYDKRIWNGVCSLKIFILNTYFSKWFDRILRTLPTTNISFTKMVWSWLFKMIWWRHANDDSDENFKNSENGHTLVRTVVKQSLIISRISLKCQLSKNWQNKIWPQMAISTRFGSFGQIPIPQNNPIKLQLFRFPNF